MTRVLFFEPQIAGNTGNAIRMAAGSGAELHLVNPRFDFEDAKLRRAGLDYHDLAVVTVHSSFADALETLKSTGPTRVFAFSARAQRVHTDVAYKPNDVLLFGPEPTGLPEEILRHHAISDALRIPMLPGRRSMNLANCAAVAVYEAWRQQGFLGGK